MRNLGRNYTFSNNQHVGDIWGFETQWDMLGSKYARKQGRGTGTDSCLEKPSERQK